MRELLWYKENAVLKTRNDKLLLLSNIRYLLEILQQTIVEFYCNKNYFMFDPHVGENACQVRTMMILSLTKTNHERALVLLSVLKQQEYLLQSTINHFQHLAQQNRSHKHSLLDKLETINQFMFEYGLNIEVDDIIELLFYCYFLTKFNNASSHSYASTIDIPRISEEMQITRNLVDRMVGVYQCRVAKKSCDFICALTPDNIDFFRRQDACGRENLPCFLASSIIFNYAIQQKITFLLKVFNVDKSMELNILYLPDQKPQIVSIDFTPSVVDKPCFVIQGLSYWLQEESKHFFLEKLQTFSIEDLFLGNMASHKQYAGTHIDDCEMKKMLALQAKHNLNAKKILKNYENMYSFAVRENLLISQEPFLLIKHAFCDSIARQLETSICAPFVYTSEKSANLSVNM